MEDIKKLLGQRIRELRRQRGYTQEELAEMINIDQRNLSNIECGITFPSRSLLALAKALETELRDMFDFEHVNHNKDDMKLYISNSLVNLGDKEIRILYRLVKSMV